MSTASRNDIDEHVNDCDDSTFAWAALLATGSAMLLGYAVGRITYSNDLRSALRRIEASPEPIDVFIRTL
jgi:hypothetical protein